MAYDYLWCVNRLCYKLNEVPLTSSTFASADGVYNDFKESVNAAIFDIYQEEDTQWPFAWANTSVYVTAGNGGPYTPATNIDYIDWDSFYIDKPAISLTITQSSGTATATSDANGHLFETGDSVVISGANQSDYNGTFTITKTGTTTFTFPVDSGATSPATGTIVAYGPIEGKKLTPIDYSAYRDESQYLISDVNRYQTSHYVPPEVVVRRDDNKIVISPKPDRSYKINYDYYTLPTAMTTYSDVPSIPEKFKETIIQGALYYAYMFRDNTEQATAAQEKFVDMVNKMRRILIPQPHFIRVVN